MSRFYDGALHDTTDFSSGLDYEVNSCGLHSGGALTVIREKGRRDYHLLYVKKGCLEVEISGKLYSLGENGFALYAPFEKQLYRTSDNCERYWLHFSGTQAESMLSGLGFGQGTYEAKGAYEVCGIFDELIHEYILPAADSKKKNAVLLQLLFLRLHDSVSVRYVNPGVSMLAKRMNTDFASRIDVEQYIKMSGLGKDRFVHLFKETLGEPPHKYLTGIRMREAVQLLKYTSLSVSQVAFAVGYEDSLYFSRIFKKYCGVSPKKLRENN